MEKYRIEYDPMLIGQNLKRLRIAKKLSIQDVQFYLRLGSEQAVYMYESGKRVPPGDNLLALMQLYSATVEDLINEPVVEIFDDNCKACETHQTYLEEEVVQLKDYKDITFYHNYVISMNCDFDITISFEDIKNKVNKHEAIVSYAEHIKAHMNEKAS